MNEALVLVLASASAGRLATLRAAGVDPLVRASAVDEDTVLVEGRHRYGALRPAETALLLARAKCEDVAADPPAAADLVLGCDSIFELDGVAHGKPDCPAAARERWRAMSGRTGVLHTGHWLIDVRPGEAGGSAASLGRCVSTAVTFASVSDADIAAYVATGEPLACAGAFTIDGYGGAFVAGVSGDPHNVVGLSLPVLREMLGTVGVSWPRLWRHRTGASSR